MDGFSERYEFDAPSHVVDLKELQNSEFSDDKWFEQQAGGADGPHPLLSSPDCPIVRCGSPSMPSAAESQVKRDVDTDPSSSTTSPSNIVTCWGAKVMKTNAQSRRKTTGNQPPARQSRVSKRTSGSATEASAAPPSKKHRLSASARSVRKSTRILHRGAQLRATATHATASNTANTEPASSEEQELARIRSLQREVALHRKKNEASYKAALVGAPLPKKTVLSTTVPKEFHFSTDARVKTSSISSTVEKDICLKKAKPRKGATVPKPFNLSTGSKRKMDERETYVPMAQQIERFQKRTPDRYHLRSRRSQETGPLPVKADHPTLTMPHTPKLMTRQRNRLATVKSSAELEAEEVDKLQNFKFKALELNRKILQNAEALKKPPVKESTVPESFELQIEKRLQEKQAVKKSNRQEDEEKPHSFKAQPVSKKILEGVVGLPCKKPLHPTVPESPAFALKNRVRVDRKVDEEKPPSPVKSSQVPHFGLPFQPRLPENHQVEVRPFSFDERDRERRVLKEKRLEEQRHGEVLQFKAQPLPDFDAVVLPEKKMLEPTKPEPFKLLLDERGAAKNSRWEQMIKEEQKRQEEAASFKARPNTVTHKEPFQPRKECRTAVGSHSSTVVEAFELSTERRARERQEFERMANEKEALRAHMEEEQRREKEQREKEEIAMLRQQQVHKAQPIRRYKPVEVKQSDVLLTIPQSPNFSDRFRL
ncbi:targeting protein for Xklp2 isoform X2 [Echeneis naucrates]|uniref:targeting protein for Xklp2 isoform X2 n=1 Tax=Echeneis naucrates TaxID=173247 RepID=UPI00111414EC|nr:targeting protein for Xklp2 isoform X2 [Echeneis naucrates]